MVAVRIRPLRRQEHAQTRDTPPINNQIAGVHTANRSITIPSAVAAQQITNGWRGVVGDENSPLISMQLNVPGGALHCR